MDVALLYATDIVDQLMLLLPATWTVAYLRPDWPVVTELPPDADPASGQPGVNPHLRTALLQRALARLLQFHETDERRAVRWAVCRRNGDVTWTLDVVFLDGAKRSHVVREDDRVFSGALCAALQAAPPPPESHRLMAYAPVAIYEPWPNIWTWSWSNPMAERAQAIGAAPGWRAFAGANLRLEPPIALSFTSVVAAKLGAPLVVHRGSLRWFITAA